MDAIEIARTGMDIEWRRLEVIADNIANANTTRTALGEAFRPHRLVSGPMANFGAYLDAEAAGRPPVGVTVYGVEPVKDAPRKVYEPTHPQADEEGYVSYPALDQAAEMTLMVKTARSYEADIVVMNMARQMYSKGLELGKR